MSNFYVPKGYRERERRGLERSRRRAGGVSDEIRAQRRALIESMKEHVAAEAVETNETSPADEIDAPEGGNPAGDTPKTDTPEGGEKPAEPAKPAGRTRKAKG